MYAVRTNVRDANGAYAVDAPESIAAAAVVAPITELARRLRAAGLPVSPSDTMTAIRALSVVDLEHREQVRATLRATLVKNPGHTRLFTQIFDIVFPRLPVPSNNPAPNSTEAATGAGTPSDASLEEQLAEAMRMGDEDRLDELTQSAVDELTKVDDGRSAGHHTQRVLRRMNLPAVYQNMLKNEGERTDFERALDAAEAAAAMEQLQRRIADLVQQRHHQNQDDEPVVKAGDMSDVELLHASSEELLAIRNALRPLARSLAAKLGLKRKRGRGGLDMRRTIRSSMGYGGVPVTPQYRRKRPTRPDLVVLCDVSGSTAEFATFTLALLHAVHQEFNRVRTFVFVDGIVEITDILATNPGVLEPRLLLDRQGLVARDGRSDYTEAFKRFLSSWSDAVSAKTTVIIVGDARQHDRPPAIAQMSEIEHRARKLYWFNPEPVQEWDRNDSRMSEYAVHCSAVYEVATLQQLVDAVADVA